MKTAELDPALQQAAECACFNIRRAARRITQTYDEALRPLGLRATQMTILAVAARRGEAMISQLADVTGTDRTTLTRNLRLLQQQGWIRVRPGADRRERVVRISPKGRALLARAIPVWKKTQDRTVATLGQRRYRRLLSDLEEVAR